MPVSWPIPPLPKMFVRHADLLQTNTRNLALIDTKWVRTYLVLLRTNFGKSHWILQFKNIRSILVGKSHSWERQRSLLVKYIRDKNTGNLALTNLSNTFMIKWMKSIIECWNYLSFHPFRLLSSPLASRRLQQQEQQQQLSFLLFLLSKINKTIDSLIDLYCDLEVRNKN